MILISRVYKTNSEEARLASEMCREVSAMYKFVAGG